MFRRDEKLRAELDALFFRLYGIDDRDDVDYILETPQTEPGGLKHNEIKEYGYYRTKAWILNECDHMVAADIAALPYASAITTASGDRPRYPVRTRQAVRDTPKADPWLGQ